MKRRAFLKAAVGLTVAAALPALPKAILPTGDGVALFSGNHPSWGMTDDYYEALGQRRVLALASSMTETWRRAMEPGLAKYFSDAYAGGIPDVYRS